MLIKIRANTQEDNLADARNGNGVLDAYTGW